MFPLVKLRVSRTCREKVCFSLDILTVGRHSFVHFIIIGIIVHCTSLNAIDRNFGAKFYGLAEKRNPCYKIENNFQFVRTSVRLSFLRIYDESRD